MFTRILVANRGEIVCRIARTVRRMGLTMLAVYSDADANALHVRSADEAYRLGSAPAAGSYLDVDRILEVARQARAEAIHPGYGFLSENAAFASRCVESGFVFIGPPADAILAMGSKSAAKASMDAAGVPVAPGYHGLDQSGERLRAEAQRIGFPLIIKASAGGGGKGMSVVRGLEDVTAAIASAQRLAQAAFGDARLLLERYFPRARHVEVQVFAARGEVVALFDRDCSVQRRHQKIIEEAPAPGLRDEVRAAMAHAAVTAARAVKYEGAGTVEFLVDEDQQFYFMEMNTRLQVEHPVTEFITGIDLVEWQIRAARGEALPAARGNARPIGAAVEARVYAEDPSEDYMPSVGKITHLRWPGPRPDLRLDVGFEGGDEVSSYYDPMLGKVIAWGESRVQAVDALHRALAELEIIGVRTNRALLMSVLADEEFRGGAVATDFLERRAAHLQFAERAPAADEDVVVAALWSSLSESGRDVLWSDTQGWRLGRPPSSRWTLGGRSAVVDRLGEASYAVHVGGVEWLVRGPRRIGLALQAQIAGRRVTARIVEQGAEVHVFSGGRHARLNRAHTEDSLQSRPVAEQGSLRTPLPGTLVAVHVKAGDAVSRGAALVTVEAMKMEHTVRAPRDGVVARVMFGVSDRVSADAVLVELSAPPL